MLTSVISKCIVFQNNITILESVVSKCLLLMLNYLYFDVCDTNMYGFATGMLLFSSHGLEHVWFCG